MSVTFGGACGDSDATMSASSSIAVKCATRGARRKVSAPGPGPISTNRSSGFGARASTSLSAHADSRKCWPYRFFARGRMPNQQSTITIDNRQSNKSALRNRLDLVQRFPAPVFLFDLLDLVLVHAEVVAALVNDGLAPAFANLIVIFTSLFDRLLIDRDAIRESVAVSPA